MERLLEILEEIKPGIDFKNEKALISDGILESFDIISLVASLNDEFDISIEISDLVPENFETVEAINNLINQLGA